MDEIDGWISAGKLEDFIHGKKQFIIYANTEQMKWQIGVIYG